jgi:enamine deaminase RidA (YjgF/YER057c/UK114 family)
MTSRSVTPTGYTDDSSSSPVALGVEWRAEDPDVQKSDLVIPASMQGMYDRFHFAPAVRAGELLLCSGQIGIGPDGRAPDDLEKQFTLAFEAVKAILDEAKLGFSDVVELTTFHVGLLQQIGVFMAVKDRYLPAPFPAWTAIGVSELAFPGGLAEVRVTARLRKPAARAAAGAKRSKAKAKTKRRVAKKAGRRR